ncbi:AfsR/SARP family transcriptional regulator [Actinomadura rupiterrae]|uniref:AfsR/SARP family transcriptional regulator n=1 Tax=Actinomadura rupiterrae TaxID=559627 RepID=UPI0020A24666|nr:bacterial transcriptional activator domain-containing protein [Actinomadura rupiterrae]MCP2337290.1 DNA-binding SARP family transcriptional activator [Actinomadura rupiterrae]
MIQTEGRTDGWPLLGLLAEFRNLPLPRLTAYSRLWPDSDPAEDRDAFWRPMREARGHLLKALGGGPAASQVIQKIGRSSYRLNAGFCQTDVWQLRDKLNAARAAPTTSKAALLRTAVDLYTGPYLPDCDHEFATTARRALDREVVQALVQLAETSAPEQAPIYLERATTIAPTSEHLYRSRIQAYAALGNTTAAHHCYQELTEFLTPLKLRPSASTVDTYRRATRDH